MAGLVVAAPAVARPGPTLVATQPSVVVRGMHFHPSERVRLTLYYDMTAARRTVRASRLGSFTASLGALEGFDPCSSGFSVAAVGAAGGHAVLRVLPRACPPP